MAPHNDPMKSPSGYPLTILSMPPLLVQAKREVNWRVTRWETRARYGARQVAGLEQIPGAKTLRGGGGGERVKYVCRSQCR
jgi:hypothetical protein